MLDCCWWLPEYCKKTRAKLLCGCEGALGGFSLQKVSKDVLLALLEMNGQIRIFQGLLDDSVIRQVTEYLHLFIPW